MFFHLGTFFIFLLTPKVNLTVMFKPKPTASTIAYEGLLNFFAGPHSENPIPITHPDELVNQEAMRDVATYRQAAVLIAVTRSSETNRSEIVLTVRAAHLKSHGGQISLPGGTKEDQDPDFQATALRESEEEIGLLAHQVQVLGKLGDMALPSGFRITPFVGLIDSGLNFVAAPEEVAEIFHAPLELLLDPSAYTKTTMEFNGENRVILEVVFEEYRIWGATAAILYHLAKQVRRTSP
jgi:8-oxo-dGTP pyrophosphatase MutT (NUDIX family)